MSKLKINFFFYKYPKTLRFIFFNKNYIFDNLDLKNKIFFFFYTKNPH